MLFWRGPVEVTAQVIDAKEHPEVPASLITAMVRLTAQAPVFYTMVEEGKIGLLYIDGRLVRTLEPGTRAFWQVAGAARVEQVDLRRQTLEIPGQEILTKDKVSIRVNVWAEFQIVDAVTAKASVKDANDYLYRVLQLAVRQTLGVRTLEEISREAGAGQPDPPAGGDGGHAVAIEHRQADAGQPSFGAVEGTGDIGEGRREGGEDHRARRI